MFNHIRYRCLRIRENYGLIFFHFLHSASAILLLLLVGQVANHSDSTKAKLFKLILPIEFNNENLWYWIIGLLSTKFVATFFKNYFHHIVNFQIHNKILQHQLIDFGFHKQKSIEQDTSRYVKSYSKGVLLLISDLFLLTLIFLLLSKLNDSIAGYWLIFLLSGLAIRLLVVRYFISSKYQFKRAINSMNRKWNFIFHHQWSLIMDQQFNKEYNILKNREKTAEMAMKKFGGQYAWTAGFFPVYFYIFLFVIAWNFQSIETSQTNILQIILLIIYSQSASMRMFKIPAHWKEMSEIESRWNPAQSDQTANSESFGQEETLKYTNDWDLSNYPKSSLIKLVSDSYDHTKRFELLKNQFFQSVFILDMNREIIGDTFLGAILTDKESRQMQVFEQLILEAPPYDWTDFNWKNKLDLEVLTREQLIWIYFFKAILHPGKTIIFHQPEKNNISSSDIEIFVNLARENHKVIYFIHEKDI